MNYPRVLYDITTDDSFPGLLVSTLIVSIVGILIILFQKHYVIVEKGDDEGYYNRRTTIGLGRIVLIAGIILTLFVSLPAWINDHQQTNEFRTGKYLKVEGLVENYHPEESKEFTINGVRFDYHKVNVGQRRGYDGPQIWNGLNVQIYYTDDHGENVVLRMATQ